MVKRKTRRKRGGMGVPNFIKKELIDKKKFFYGN